MNKYERRAYFKYLRWGFGGMEPAAVMIYIYIYIERERDIVFCTKDLVCLILRTFLPTILPGGGRRVISSHAIYGYSREKSILLSFIAKLTFFTPHLIAFR